MRNNHSQVCATGNMIRAEQSAEVQSRVSFNELDATSPDWPVADADYDLVLMSYISGSVRNRVYNVFICMNI